MYVCIYIYIYVYNTMLYYVILCYTMLYLYNTSYTMILTTLLYYNDTDTDPDIINDIEQILILLTTRH